MMISLRKSIEMDLEGVLQSALDSYCATIEAMGAASERACPPAAESLPDSLQELNARLSAEVSPADIAQTREKVKEELARWSERAALYYLEKNNEIRDILTLLSKTAEEVGDRDQRVAKQLIALTERLQATTKLQDLPAMRRSIGRGVTDLKSTLTQMTKEGEDSISQLRSQLAAYQSRLEEVEKVAALDSLTGLANRSTVERQIQSRIAEGRVFSLIYMDLNGFKEINDTLGHLAGDDLLRKFAHEIRMIFRATDVVGRMGGDEFVVVMDTEFREAKAQIERIQKWVNGEYEITVGSSKQKVKINTATGVSTWHPGDSMMDVMGRADAAMYADKAERKASR